MVSQKIYGSYEEQLQLRWEIFINTLTVYASRDLSVLQTKLVDDKRKFPYDFKEILAVILPSFVYVCPFSIISTHPRVFQLPLFQITVHCNFPVDHSSHTPEGLFLLLGLFSVIPGCVVTPEHLKLETYQEKEQAMSVFLGYLTQYNLFQIHLFP